MDDELRHIWKMIGALSEAHWQRAARSDRGLLADLLADPYQPEGEEERAIWQELTAPHHFDALRRFVETQRRLNTNEFAARLNESLLAEAVRRRMEMDSRDSSPLSA